MRDAALWLMRHRMPGYSLHGSEDEAAESGARMEDNEGGHVLGVQFPDGRTIARADWAPFLAARQRLAAETRKRIAEDVADPPPARRILDPFGGQQLTVLDEEPGWLGRPA